MNKRGLFFLFALLIILPCISHARWKYRVTPMLRNGTLYYPENVPNTKNFRNVFHAEFNAVYRWKNWFKLVLQPVSDFDPTAQKSPTTIVGAEKNSERFFYDLREGYMQFRFRPFSLSAGNMIYSWGVTDGFSPADVVNPRRFVSPMNTEKIGAPSINLNWIQGDFDAELIYIPVQRRSVFPGEDSRWLPRSIYMSNAFDGYLLQLPSNLQYYYLPHVELDNSLKNNFAGRLRGQLGGLDFSLVYFEGASTTPEMNIQIDATILRDKSASQSGLIAVGNNFGLKPVYYKRRVYGGTVVFTVKEFIVRYETAYTQQVSKNALNALPGDYYENVASLEHDFPVGSSNITAVLQGTYTRYSSNAENGTTSLSRIFEKAGILGLRYAPNEKWSLIGSCLRDIKYKGSVFALNIEHKLHDNLTASVAGSLITGEGTSPLGTYKKNNLLAANLRYDF